MNSLKKVLAGILSGFMVISTVSQVQPPVLAQETTQSSESEGTKAKTRNIEVRQNSAFDIETDFQAIENLKDLDASVSLKQAENKEGQPFDIHTPGVYMAVYEISPRNGEASYEQKLILQWCLITVNPMKLCRILKHQEPVENKTRKLEMNLLI